MKLKQAAIEKILALAFITASTILSINGCAKVDSSLPSDPYPANGLPRPVVDSISPSGGALAGIDTITIYGRNFSADKANDGIYFNTTLLYNTSILSASTTRLAVKAPAMSGDTIMIRVYVIGALDFSPTVIYKLRAAIAPFGKFASGEGGYGLCAGSDGNLYASISNANLAVKDEGIFKITSDGTVVRPPYVLPTTSPINTNWPATKFGPDKNIYSVKGNRVVYQLVPGQTNPGGTLWISSFTPAATSFNDLDFDPNHNLWAAGNNKNIYRINITDKSTKAFPFTGNIKSVRYFSGYLYFAATVGAASQVWRAPITADTLGTPEKYFDLSSDPTGGANIYGITFSADGNMYAGTDSSDFLIVVHPNGTYETPYALYVASQVLTSPVSSFAWIGTTLYATTVAGTLLKIEAGKPGAPYYGIQ